jgi:hypothetical protein
MNTFYPFIHKIKKNKKEECIPLYIELEPPILEPKDTEKSAQDKEHVTIIELF